MELLNRLTIKNLLLNKKRTAVTIIGIILSTALITGVATLLTSFQTSVIEETKKDSGDYHYEFSDVPLEDLKYISNNRNLEKTYVTQEIGYSILKDSQNEGKPYLYLLAYDSNALKNLGVKLIEGRLPENDDEILVSAHIRTTANVIYNVGDEITLPIGKRMINGEELDQSNPYNSSADMSKEYNYNGEIEETEEFIEEYTKKYKVVGIMQRPNFDFEKYYSPGYTVITRLKNPIESKNVNIYARYKNLRKQDEVTASILGISNDEYSDYKKGKDVELKYDLDKNTSLTRWENLEFSDATGTMIATVAAVVIGIIIVTSVFCIRNSFAISITEKTKQYGMLASVGATSKQIKKNVLYEGFILGIIGIPLGIISGIIAIYILLKVVAQILSSSILGLELIFDVSFLGIIMSVILSIITIYLSARKSAKRASKISPIEAIRSSEDIKIKSKKVKSPKIIKKLFGIGGDLAYKNLKRNNKKYRTTVISIIVSVTIFISMTSFLNYTLKATGIYYTDYKYNIAISGNLEESYDKMKEVAKSELVKSYSLIRSMNIKVKNSEISKHITKEASDAYYFDDENNTSGETYLNVLSLGEQEYKRYIKDIGLDYNDAKNKIIIIDDITIYETVNGKSAYHMYRLYDYKKGDKIQAELNNNTKLELEVATNTEKRPKGYESTYSNTGFIIVSDEFIEKYSDQIAERVELYIDSSNPNKLEEQINKTYKEDFQHVQNIQQYVDEQKSMILVISIFLYGFITVISLIGVTNIFNTITTNMELRQKEFANLKSIGMTKKEFNRMIRLESIFYGSKSLLIGIPLGIILSVFIYKSFGINAMMPYMLPTSGIIISILAVAILIGSIMKFSLNKINKQNIIETIRKDNI